MLQNVISQAKSALENTNLTGVPVMRQDVSAENQAPNAGFDMGQVRAFLALKLWGTHIRSRLKLLPDFKLYISVVLRNET